MLTGLMMSLIDADLCGMVQNVRHGDKEGNGKAVSGQVCVRASGNLAVLPGVPGEGGLTG